MPPSGGDELGVSLGGVVAAAAVGVLYSVRAQVDEHIGPSTR